MKQIVLFSFLCFSILNLAAQDVSVNPNPAEYVNLTTNLSDNFTEEINHANLNNNTQDSVYLGWTRRIVDAPAEWEFPVCDKNTCYFSGVSVAPNVVAMAGGETSLLDVHVFPRGVPGCGTVEIDIHLFNDPTTVLYTTTYTYRLNADEDCVALTAIDEVRVNKINVFPNPTSDLFNISEIANIQEIDEVAIYNVVGIKVKSFAPSSSYSIGDLPNGLYLVSLIDDETGVVKTIRLRKQVLRP